MKNINMGMCSEVKSSKCFIATNVKEQRHIFTVGIELYRYDINGLNGGLEMYAYIGGISDTDEINNCPFCGEEVSNTHADGTVTCDSCGRRFGVVETDPEE